LHIISHISYQEVYPLGQTIAVSAIGHSNHEIAEYGIKSFENWDDKDGDKSFLPSSLVQVGFKNMQMMLLMN
jgi:hypothetical protein